MSARRITCTFSRDAGHRIACHIIIRYTREGPRKTANLRGKSRRSPRFPDAFNERRLALGSREGTEEEISSSSSSREESPRPLTYVRTTNARRNKHVCSFFFSPPEFPSFSYPLSLSLTRTRAFVNLAISTTFMCCWWWCCCCPGYFPLVTSSGCTRREKGGLGGGERKACGATNNVSACNSGIGIHMPLYRVSDSQMVARSPVVCLYRENP